MNHLSENELVRWQNQVECYDLNRYYSLTGDELFKLSRTFDFMNDRIRAYSDDAGEAYGFVDELREEILELEDSIENLNDEIYSLQDYISDLEEKARMYDDLCR